MPLKDFKVLTFDIVGTLIDFEGGMLAYLRKAIPDCKISDEDFLAAYRAARSDGAWGYRQADNLHVAQSQYHDIGVSKRLGITTCWIERRHGKSSSGGTIASEHTVPDYHFHTLAQLANAVEAGQ